MENLLIYLVVLTLGIILGYYLNNWYNKVTKRVSLLESQVYLMLKVAEKIGVQEAELENAKNIAGGKVTVGFGE